METTETMVLRISGLSVDCIIGDLPEERGREQRLRVDAELTVPLAAALSDDLHDTADYAALAGRVRKALAAARCRMIERAAMLALEACLADPNVLHARVRVTKCGAVPGLESAAAELSGGQGKWKS